MCGMVCLVRGVALALALLLGGWPATVISARAQGPEPVNLSGRVTNGQGEPVAGARVVARGAAERSAVTDRSGRFRIAPLPAGRYSVRAEAPGYRGAERTVSATEAVTMALVLEPAPVALAPVRVSAIRAGAGTTAATLPVKVDVVSEEEVRQQQALASNPTELLANVVPSFSPGRLVNYVTASAPPSRGPATTGWTGTGWGGGRTTWPRSASARWTCSAR